MVERFFDGYVLRAAKAWGVLQPTLHRIIGDEIAKPGQRILQRIASYHGTTVEWLRNGAGPDPFDPEVIARAAARGWGRLVEQLDLPAALHRAMLGLPNQTAAAHRVLCTWGMERMEGSAKSEAAAFAQRAAYVAAGLEAQLWKGYFMNLIAAFGSDAVREKLVSEQQRVIAGFQRIGLELLNDPGGTIELDNAVKRLEYKEPERLPIILAGNPSLPPLNATMATPRRRGRPRTVSHRADVASGPIDNLRGQP